MKANFALTKTHDADERRAVPSSALGTNAVLHETNFAKLKTHAGDKRRAMLSSALGTNAVLHETNFENILGKRKNGKVRDIYTRDDKLIVVTTDRQSAFDSVLTAIPCKGHVLAGVSAYWFEKTRDIVPNALIAMPHPNVSIMKKLQMINAEFIVRGYLTGVSSTSVWTAYQKGSRHYAGYTLPEGMIKNEPFKEPLVTPSTKNTAGDQTVSGTDLVQMGILSQEEWEKCHKIVLALFRRGQEIALARGLILVDTKYELGRDPSTNQILLADEVHTPDSSRYWLADDYEKRIHAGLEPRYIDKEFLRIWYHQQGDPYALIRAGKLPSPPPELLCELALRYITLYEFITGLSFPLSALSAKKDGVESISQEIETVLTAYFQHT